MKPEPTADIPPKKSLEKKSLDTQQFNKKESGHPIKKESKSLGTQQFNNKFDVARKGCPEQTSSAIARRSAMKFVVNFVIAPVLAP